MMTLQRFEAQTCLLPYLIGDCVAREMAEFLPAPPPADLPDYLARRALVVAAANARLMRKLKAESGRDLLYAFMRHWAAAELARRFGRAHLTRLPAGYGCGKSPR